MQKLWTLGRAGLRLLLRYIVWATVFIVYIAALMEVTLLNALYLVILITFMGFPTLRERFWVALVIYCVAALFIVYLWGFPIHGSYPSVERLLGLDSKVHSHMWRTMHWHIGILVLSATQLLLFRWSTSTKTTSINGTNGRHSPTPPRRSTSSTPLPPPVEGEGVTSAAAPGAPGEPGADAASANAAHAPHASFVTWIEAGVFRVWPLLTAVAVLCAGILGKVCLIRLGYLVLLCFQIFLRELKIPALTKNANLLVMLYAAIVLIGKYMYQFDSLRRRLDRVLAADWREDIGLQVMDSQLNLFRYLVRLDKGATWEKKG